MGRVIDLRTPGDSELAESSADWDGYGSNPPRGNVIGKANDVWDLTVGNSVDTTIQRKTELLLRTMRTSRTYEAQCSKWAQAWFPEISGCRLGGVPQASHDVTQNAAAVWSCEPGKQLLCNHTSHKPSVLGPQSRNCCFVIQLVIGNRDNEMQDHRLHFGENNGASQGPIHHSSCAF